jgi:hypothetical protein
MLLPRTELHRAITSELLPRRISGVNWWGAKKIRGSSKLCFPKVTPFVSAGTIRMGSTKTKTSASSAQSSVTREGAYVIRCGLCRSSSAQRTLRSFRILREMFNNWLTFRCRVQICGGLTYTQERAQLIAQQAAQMCTEK